MVLIAGILSLSSLLLLTGCADKTPPLTATITFSDGMQMSGTVVRRDDRSLTLNLPTGDTHTYLYSELKNIDFAGGPDVDAPQIDAFSASSSTPSSSGKTSGTVDANAKTITVPPGVVIPVRTNGVLDSCCLTIGTMSLGNVDTAVKGPDGRVLIPADSNVTILVRELKSVNKQAQLQFELGSADFNGRHYLITSDPGAIANFAGPVFGSQEAKTRGLDIHLEDQTIMNFKTAAPTVLRLSD